MKLTCSPIIQCAEGFEIGKGKTGKMEFPSKKAALKAFMGILQEHHGPSWVINRLPGNIISKGTLFCVSSATEKKEWLFLVTVQ